MHVVTCATNAAQNVEKCVRRCGLEVDDIILEQLASRLLGAEPRTRRSVMPGGHRWWYHRYRDFRRWCDPVTPR